MPGPVLQCGVIGEIVQKILGCVDVEERFSILKLLAALLDVAGHSSVEYNPHVYKDLCICCFNSEQILFMHTANMLLNDDLKQDHETPSLRYGLVGLPPGKVNRKMAVNNYSPRINISDENGMQELPSFPFHLFTHRMDTELCNLYGKVIWLVETGQAMDGNPTQPAQDLTEM